MNCARGTLRRSSSEALSESARGTTGLLHGESLLILNWFCVCVPNSSSDYDSNRILLTRMRR